MSQEIVEILERMYDAARRRDFDAFPALHDPNATVIPLILDIEGGGYRGHEGVRRFWSEIHSAFPDWHWVAERIQSFDEGALVAIRIRGHAKGSGVTIDQAAWQVVKLAGGKIVWWQIFRTEAEAIEAAGIPDLKSGP